MIDERGDAIAIDDALATVQAKEIRVGKVVVEIVGLVGGEAFADVLDDERAFADRARSVATKE